CRPIVNLLEDFEGRERLMDLGTKRWKRRYLVVLPWSLPSPRLFHLSVPSISKALHRNRSLNRRMGIIVQQFEILIFKTKDIFDFRVQFHFRQRPAISRQL